MLCQGLIILNKQGLHIFIQKIFKIIHIFDLTPYLLLWPDNSHDLQYRPEPPAAFRGVSPTYCLLYSRHNAI